jgi:cbb3-type cytochrome oxidase maturation protein
MIDYFFLVPIAIGMGLVGLASFMWTMKNGQYDDLEGAAHRILLEGHEGPLPDIRHSEVSRPIAFSSEVDSGSRRENASKQETGAPFRFNRNGKSSSDASPQG